MALLALLAAFCLVRTRRQPAWPALLGAYLVTLLPVMGLVQVGAQAMADRYTYLPGLVVAVAVGAAVSRLLMVTPPHPAVRALVAAPVALVLALWVGLSVRQIGVWHDSETLWSHVLRHQPDNIEAHNNRADYYCQAGRLAQALADYTAALAATPVLAPEHVSKRRAAIFNDRAVTLARLGGLKDAVADQSEAIRLRPDRADYYANRARMLEQLGRADAAALDWRRAERRGRRPVSTSTRETRFYCAGGLYGTTGAGAGGKTGAGGGPGSSISGVPGW